MRYDILLTETAGNGYVARPLLWPEVVASGANEAEALAAVQEALTAVLAKSRVVQIELPEPNTDDCDPWLPFVGMWKDMPEEEWESFQQSLKAIREAANHEAELPPNGVAGQ